MAYRVYLVIVLTIIVIHGPTSEAKCNEGESCIDKNDCPRYKSYIETKDTMTKAERKEERKQLKSKICNRKPQKLCCKNTILRLTTTTTSSTCNSGRKNYSPSNLPQEGQCGVACVGSSSVVRGEDASLGEFPWAALLTTERVIPKWDNRRKEWGNETIKENSCGGTLINSWFVLTAAHCHTRKVPITEVVLGEWDALKDPDCPAGGSRCNNPKVQRIEVAEVIIHSSYDPYKWDSPNDIALIRMKTEARYNIFVQPICLPLPEYGQILHHKYATVVGWGASKQDIGGSKHEKTLQEHGIYTEKLQKGELTILPQSECEIQSTQICASNEKKKTDSCRGDSGGGLFINSGDYPGQSFGNVHVQVGVVSYGSRLCGDAPGVYTKVEEFIPWIKEKISSS